MPGKVIVTGKNGTVGSNLDFAGGYSSKEYNLESITDTYRMLAVSRPDAIIHCAARVGGLDEHLKYKKRLFVDNIQINMNVLGAAKELGIPRVLSFLSSCIYSHKATQPYNEENIHDGEPFPDYYPYGYSKRLLEVQSRIYFEEYGLKYNCIIPTNIYGIHDNFNINTGHVIGVLIHKVFLANQNNTDLVVWGNGEQKRQFLFTKDVAVLTKWALENYLDKEPLIFANDETLRIKDIVEIIADKIKIKNKVIFDTSKPSGQEVRILDGSKLKGLFPYRFTSIEQGLSETIEWFLAQYPYIRL